MEVQSRVLRIVANSLNIAKSQINDHDHVVNDLGADSLDTAELIVAIEKEFRIVIQDDEAMELLKVSDIVAYVEGRLNVPTA